MRYLSSVSLRIGLACSVIILQACVVAPERQLLVSQEPSLANALPAPELDRVSNGEEVVFYSGLLGSLGPMTIGREYHSASGRVCKQLYKRSGEDPMAVACKSAQGEWYLRHRS